MVSSYAAIKGRVATARIEQSARQEVMPIGGAELAAAEQAKAFICTHMQDALPFIKALVEEGMLSGWRGIVNCRLLEQQDK